MDKVSCHQGHKVGRNGIFHVKLIYTLLFQVGTLGGTHQHLYACWGLENQHRTSTPEMTTDKWQQHRTLWVFLSMLKRMYIKNNYLDNIKCKISAGFLDHSPPSPWKYANKKRYSSYIAWVLMPAPPKVPTYQIISSTQNATSFDAAFIKLWVFFPIKNW